jgi:hypothetical protein
MKPRRFGVRPFIAAAWVVGWLASRRGSLPVRAVPTRYRLPFQVRGILFDSPEVPAPMVPWFMYSRLSLACSISRHSLSTVAPRISSSEYIYDHLYHSVHHILYIALYSLLSARHSRGIGHDWPRVQHNTVHRYRP